MRVMLMTNAPAQASIHLAGTEAAPFNPGRHRTHRRLAPVAQSSDRWRERSSKTTSARPGGPHYLMSGVMRNG